MKRLERQCQNYLDMVSDLHGIEPIHTPSLSPSIISSWLTGNTPDLTMENLRQRCLTGTIKKQKNRTTIKTIPDKLSGQSGKALSFSYGCVPSPFGYAFIVFSEHGVTWLAFDDEPCTQAQLALIKSQWPKAELKQQDGAANIVIQRIFASDEPVTVWVKATPFQLTVWKALLDIPVGALTTYGNLAKSIVKPKATRAVASAVASNPVSWLVPCHRVIPATGKPGNYRWGTTRKQLMILKESVVH